MKKLSFITGILLAAAMVVIAPATVKAAGMPCTEDTIKQFQANLQVAQQELAVAQQAKVQADANVTTLKAQGVTGLQLLQATDAATNAANIVSAYQHKVNCAQQNLDAIISRGNTEQYVLDYEAKVKARCNLDSIKVQLDGANQVTSAALTQLKNIQGELLKAQNNAAGNPALAANVVAMQSAVASAEANYAQAKAKSDALAAQYAQTAGTTNWATDADNAAYVDFVNNYAKSLQVPWTVLNSKGEEETYMVYKDWNSNSKNGDVYRWHPTVWSFGQPNEWAVRWFE